MGVINMAQDRDRWQAVVSLRVLYDAGDCMVGRRTVSLSRRAAKLGVVNACTYAKKITFFGARICMLPLLDDRKENYKILNAVSHVS